MDKNDFSEGRYIGIATDQVTLIVTIFHNFFFFFFVKTGGLKVNLGDNKRIKINGQRVSVPYKRSNELTITNMNDTVMVETRIGVSIVWDGRGFLEVSVPSRYKGEKVEKPLHFMLTLDCRGVSGRKLICHLLTVQTSILTNENDCTYV